MSALRDSAKQLREMAKKFLSERDSEPKCVHRTLLLRSLIILKNICPETEEFFAPIMKNLMPYAKLFHCFYCILNKGSINSHLNDH